MLTGVISREGGGGGGLIRTPRMYIPLGSHDILVGNTEEISLFIGERFTFFRKLLHELWARAGGRKNFELLVYKFTIIYY